MAWKDPIVEEVRAAGRELEARAEGDVHKFFENLRRAQPKDEERRVPNPTSVRNRKSKRSRASA